MHSQQLRLVALQVILLSTFPCLSLLAPPLIVLEADVRQSDSPSSLLPGARSHPTPTVWSAASGLHARSPLAAAAPAACRLTSADAAACHLTSADAAACHLTSAGAAACHLTSAGAGSRSACRALRLSPALASPSLCGRRTPLPAHHAHPLSPCLAPTTAIAPHACQLHLLTTRLSCGRKLPRRFSCCNRFVVVGNNHACNVFLRGRMGRRGGVRRREAGA